MHLARLFRGFDTPPAMIIEKMRDSIKQPSAINRIWVSIVVDSLLR